MRWVIRFTCICVTAACLAVTGAAQGKGRGKGKGQGKGGGANAAAANVHFATGDVQVIHQYYGAHPTGLPPGLQKNLARGKPLPPGWQKKVQPFPSGVIVQLAPACSYCGRGVIGGYGVIYDKRTAVILDVVQLVSDIVR